MKKHLGLYFFILISLFLFSAGGCVSKTESEAKAIATTISAMNAQITPLITYVYVEPYSTEAPTATSTAIPTSTSTNTPIPTSTSVVRSCNTALFISENPSDFVTYDPGESFTKSWRLQNTGTCTWNPNYRVVYASGDKITGVETKEIGTYVSPGEKIDIVYTFKAPTTAGRYRTVFYLQDDHGVTFGQFWVEFRVGSTSATSTPTSFAVTNVTFSSSDAVKTDTCPQTFDYSAAITTNKAGTVTYHWEFSDSTTTSPQTLTFSSAGTKTVSGTWDLDTTGDYWVKLYVDEPNHQLFGTLDLSLTCTPDFAVTGVTLSADEETVSGTCPHTFNYQADITTNGAGTVTYFFTFSDSTTGNTQTLDFSSAGTQSVTGTWELDATGDYWINIYIDEPNHQFFGPLDLSLTCN